MLALSVTLVFISAADPALETRYLKASRMADLGKLGPASEELELLSHKFPELADRCAFEAAQLFEKRGAQRKALELYGAVTPQSYFYAEAQLSKARVLRLQGELDDAAATVAPLAQSEVLLERRRALYELLTIANLKRDPKEKQKVQARWLLERAPWMGGAPVLALISGAHDNLLKPTACREARRATWLAPAELGCVSKLLSAEADACAGTDSSPKLLQVIQECPQIEVYSRAWMTLAAIEARAGKPESAAASFRRAGTPEATFAAFWVGWRANPDLADDDDLARLESSPVKLPAQDRARIGYWRSRVAQAHGEQADEVNILAEVALRYPASYYASLARERLQTLEAVEAPEVDLAQLMLQRDRGDEADAVTRFGPAIESLRLGLDDAPQELTALALRKPTPAGNRVAIEAFEAAGQGVYAYRFARAVFRQQVGDVQDKQLWDEAFPTRFSDLIAKNADLTNLPPAWLQGLVREESAFEPTARSHCGALGLMQLMPVTARELSQQEGNDLDETRALLDPKLNVHLGSRYLGQLMRRFEGNRIAATAAYNGGPTRVAGWMKTPSGTRPDDFVEEIPLDETRNYVKDVLASADVYRYRLAGRSAAVADSR
ncbi:MAG: transglycosylase SLT domain-containing protein [Myxococcaceae bacterium]